MAQDDRILLEQWSKRGDGEAFRALASRYSGVVYAACRRILGNRPDAEDVAQECFEALATAGTKPGAYVGAWLHRVATYHAIGHMRSEARRKQRELQYATARPQEANVEWKDIYEYIDAAIDDLPNKFRIPLIAHYLEGQTKEAVGQSLGISRQLADYRIQQGLQRVRSALQRRGIYAVAALLAGLMEANAAEATPATFAVKLGKIALAGPGTSAPVAAYAAVKAASALAAGGAAAKITIGVGIAALLVVLGLFFGWKEINRPYRTQDITEMSTFNELKASAVEKPSGSAPQDSAAKEELDEPPPAVASVQTLEPGTVIYGVVLDENSRPVSGAAVRLDNQEQIELLGLEDRRGWLHQFPSETPINLQTLSGPRGEFAFPRTVLPFRQSLILSAQSGERYAIRTIGAFGEPRQRAHELVLRPAGLVKGRIVDEKNRGVPDVLIRLGPQRMLGDMNPFQIITQADGSFASRPVPLGMYELFLSAPGYKDPGRPWLSADSQVHVIRLEREGPTSSISGWVVDVQDGRRLAGMAVNAGTQGDTTNDKGEFKIDLLTAGKYALLLGPQSAPYTVAEKTEVEVAHGRDVVGIELKVIRGATITGRILDSETKQPSPRARLDTVHKELKLWMSATADESGRYTLTGLAEGTYDIGLRRSDSFISTKGTFTLSPLKDMEGVDFLVGPFRSMRGRVVNSSGTPVAGASVVVLPTVAYFRLIGVSDAAGNFDIPVDEEIPSAYLQAYGDGCVSRRLGPIRPGEPCDLKLENSGAIDGTVVEASGKPVPEAIIIAVPGDESMITTLSPDGSEADPKRGIEGIKARTSSMGEFQMDPVLPGKYDLEVYLPSSENGYPLAVTTVNVQPGKTLQARLVMDVGATGVIEGLVTQGGSALPYVIVTAWGKDRWVTEVETYTDANGAYRLANIQPGETRVTAWEPGESRRMLHKIVQVAENQVQTVDFNFELHEGGVEGTVTINGKPGYAFIDVTSSDEDDIKTDYSAMTSQEDGYYHVSNLAPGAYTVRASNIYSSSMSRIPRESTIQVAEGETVRCDFSFDTAAIEGVVLGLRDGERAAVGLFTQPLDLATFSTLSLADLDELMAATDTLQAEERFNWDSLEPGVYYLGVIPVPVDVEIDETALRASVAKGRFYFQPVEAVMGQTATIEVSLP